MNRRQKDAGANPPATGMLLNLAQRLATIG